MRAHDVSLGNWRGLMAEQFQVGDVVRLKSGGPQMTVADTGEDMSGRQMVWCMWFDEKGARQQETFPPEALDRF